MCVCVCVSVCVGIRDDVHMHACRHVHISS